MSNENQILGALLASFADDEDVTDDGSDSFVTAPCDRTIVGETTFPTCAFDETRYESCGEGDSSLENYIFNEDFDNNDEAEATPQATMTTDRLRELIKESRESVNKSPVTKHGTSDSFPFSSSSLKASTSNLNLSQKAASIGKAIAKSNDDGRGEIFDPAFGIRVKNPKVTASTLSTYCTGFKKIRPSHLRRPMIPKEDWLTMGVIVEKSEFRKSANGNEYMIWKISDLTQFQDTPVKVLLFGECAKEHWKLQESSVVALTTPLAADSTDDKTITLKLSKAAQVIDIGYCPDFGHCKAVKQNGSKCTQYVNISSTEFCVYHIQKAAKNTLVKRAALSSQFNSPIGCRVSKPKMGLMNGERKVIGSTHTFLNASAKLSKMDAEIKPKIPVKTISKEEFQALKEQEKEKLQAVIQGNKVNFGAKNLMKYREAKNDIVKNAAVKPKANVPVDVKAFLREQKAELDKKSVTDSITLTGFSSTSNRPKTAAEINREKLVARIKAQGGLPKVDPNATRKRPAEQITITKPASIFDKENEPALNTPAKKSKLGKEYTAADIQALLGKKSTHENVIEEADRAKEDTYFSSMEVREKIETRLTDLMEVKDVRVVTCKKCDYTSEKQSSFCMIKGHLVQWHTANKRFFKCSSCKQRIIIYAMMPVKPCKNCGCTSFDRVGMKDERMVKEDKLQIRGDEIPFVNR